MRKLLNFAIPEELHIRFKIRCIEQRREMTEVLIELITEYLKRTEGRRKS